MDRLTVAYGRVSDPAAALAAEGRELETARATLGVQTALPRPDDGPFRLNSPGWLRVAPMTIPALSDGAALRTLVRTRLAACVPSHRAVVAAFLRRYLDLVEAVAPGPPVGDAVRASVRHPGDVFFDAPLPLPNAWFATAPGGFQRVDVAFWTGRTLRAAMLAEPSSVTPSVRRALATAGPQVETLWWPPSAWSEPAAMAGLLQAEVASALASGSGRGPLRAVGLLSVPVPASRRSAIPPE